VSSGRTMALDAPAIFDNSGDWDSSRGAVMRHSGDERFKIGDIRTGGLVRCDLVTGERREAKGEGIRSRALGLASFFCERSEQLELVKRSKGARGMPRRGQAMKDVASCEKPWGGARIL
jgi:hypothetical protein